MAHHFRQSSYVGRMRSAIPSVFDGRQRLRTDARSRRKMRANPSVREDRRRELEHCLKRRVPYPREGDRESDRTHQPSRGAEETCPRGRRRGQPRVRSSRACRTERREANKYEAGRGAYGEDRGDAAMKDRRPRTGFRPTPPEAKPAPQERLVRCDLNESDEPTGPCHLHGARRLRRYRQRPKGPTLRIVWQPLRTWCRFSFSHWPFQMTAQTAHMLRGSRLKTASPRCVSLPNV